MNQLLELRNDTLEKMINGEYSGSYIADGSSITGLDYSTMTPIWTSWSVDKYGTINVKYNNETILIRGIGVFNGIYDTKGNIQNDTLTFKRMYSSSDNHLLKLNIKTLGMTIQQKKSYRYNDVIFSKGEFSMD